jgi:hypothetical protein
VPLSLSACLGLAEDNDEPLNPAEQFKLSRLCRELGPIICKSQAQHDLMDCIDPRLLLAPSLTHSRVLWKKKLLKGKRAKEVEDPFLESEADNEEEPEEDDAPQPVTPPAKPVKVYSREVYWQKEAKFAGLLKEAYALLKPGSFTFSGLECTQTPLVLAGLLDLSDEERDAVLEMNHDELVAGFKNMVSQKLKKNRDVEHEKSPEHKRIHQR